MVKFVDKDMGFNKIQHNVKRLHGRSVKVGVMGEGKVLEYAMYNEFGTSRMPARPFMQTTYDNNKSKVLKLVDQLTGDIVEGKSTPDRALAILGEFYQKEIMMTIRNAKEWAVPNDPKTIAMKGSSSPLIDTGKMLNSIRYEIS